MEYEQWGYFTTQNVSNQVYTANLPIAYETTNYVVSGWYGASASDKGDAHTGYGSTVVVSTQSFQIGAYANNGKIRFIAVGY